ncbi:ABC transporter ATP-binding protein [Carboxydothermus pertinax]|uniref:ABC transporter ATP-binding protein n=1 Tax=Carboxydothermus pertinax TaxID=870242 RepID=A0A1L8CWC2_9THEO|nr:ABC transporter ATP-binding protein [Carboxydothermus pertinax]GAV23245.1 ABC transporter ATP-binding protein [Carboxydothermus pertinax]
MVLESVDLTKYYGREIGCRNISLGVSPGEIFAFLGPNGAGKSTFVKTALGLLKPTLGTIRLFGKSPEDLHVRRKVGYLPENIRLPEWMTAEELLRFHGKLLYLPDKKLKRRIEEVLTQNKLWERKDSRIKTYSQGMRQRLALAVALLGEPELLFLDEPTSALDPVGRIEVREIITDLKKQGVAVFLNSHLLSEVEMVADSVAIINRGEIKARGKLAELLSGRGILIRGEIPEALLKKLKSQYQTGEAPNGLKLLGVSEEEVPAMMRELVLGGANIYEVRPFKAALEELFIQAVEGKNGADN